MYRTKIYPVLQKRNEMEVKKKVPKNKREQFKLQKAKSKRRIEDKNGNDD